MDENSIREIPFSSETIYDGKILHVERWQVTCPNGRTAAREIVVHKGAAAVVPVYPDGTTLLVRQHRVAVDRVTLEIPAGKLDSAGEDPHDCAVRELEEETGLRAGRMTLLTSLLTTPGFCTEKIAIYLAQDLSQGQTHPDEDEFINFERVPFDTLLDRCLSGDLRDGKTVAGVLKVYALRTRKKEEK